MRWIGGGMDHRNLELRRQGWYAVKDVPAKLVPLIGRKRLRRTLRTREHRIALLRRPAVLADFEKALAQAAAKVDHAGFLDEALEIRRELEDPTPVARAVDDDGREEVWTNADFAEEIVGKMTRAARASGHPDPAMLAKVALGEATPLDGMVPLWLAEQDIEARSKGDHRRAVAELAAWTRDNSLTPTVEAITRKAAGRYVSALLARSMDRTTIAKRLWSLSALWRWLIAKGHAEENVWRGHGVAQGGRSERDKQPERPFADAEVATLLAAARDDAMRDLMTLGALSGMRLEEMALLAVRDVDAEARTVNVREDPKTPSARRLVPIHPAVWPRIAARIAGRDAAAFVFAELGDAPGEGRQRSMAFSKRFGRFREEVGVHEKREGQRRSLVNFHSFRRWFITKAEQAGVPEPTIRSVVGHKRPGVTLGTYSGGASIEQRRGCVEAVRLPKLGKPTS